MRVKLTKTQLRQEQANLKGFRHYLPTLRLKKSLLQQEILEARAEQRRWLNVVEEQWSRFERFASLFSTGYYNPLKMVTIGKLDYVSENIAGVQLPSLASLEINIAEYSRLDSPAWLDAVLDELKSYRQAQVRALIADKRARLLQEELRQISIRVNLFEKVLIPRSQSAIRKISIFLGDQQLAAVGRAKVAKSKKARVEA